MGDKLYGSAMKAPEYRLHRHLDGVNDTLPHTVKNHGMNMAGFEDAHIQIVPSASGNPDIAIMFWSEEASEFVRMHGALNYSARGAGVSWEITVPVKSRRMIVIILSGIGVADECKVYVAGSGDIA